MKDLYQYFRIESRELLDALTGGALELEKGPSAETVTSMLRSAHTLKGASRVVRQIRISELAHNIEELLVEYRQGQTAVPRDVVNKVLSTLDQIAAELRSLEPAAAERREVSPPGPPMEEQTATAESFSTVRVGISDLDGLLRMVAEINLHAGTVREMAESLASGLRKPDFFSAPLEAGNGAETASALQQVQRTLIAGVERVERELKGVRERISDLRLLPVHTVFSALERCARDSAVAQRKEIRFVTRGGDYRLDARVLRGATDALMQLVRNAVAHGVELPELRKSAGKPAAGLIEIEARRALGELTFVCRDDGAGVDIEKVKRLAVERGLLTAGQAQAQGAAETIELILQGGMSTSLVATELSGRGIGLQAAQSIAQGLKGSLKMRSSAAGTEVEITVPASLESLEVLEVRAAGRKVALPLEAVRETRRLNQAQIATGPRGASLLVDGTMLPLVSFSDIWSDFPETPDRERRLAVILQSGTLGAALAVEGLSGRQNVVMEGVPACAGASEAVLGAYLTSAGVPVPVLAASALTSAAHRERPAAAARKKIENRPAALVIDDSLTTRILEQSILEGAGYEVELAMSGEEGLEKARTRRYDIFIVDIEMPGMNGFQFIERIRSEPELRGTPVVLVTSRASAEDKARGQRVGAQAYIAKGEFEERHFLRTIGGLINSQQR